MAKSSAKSGNLSATDFLTAPEKCPLGPVCAVYGDEAFLKAEVLQTLRRQILVGQDGEFALSVFTGGDVQLREVRDALASMSLFGGGRRLVIVEEADSFVSLYRAELEDYTAQPATDAVLVLDVKTWQSNTRLAKAVAQIGFAVECKPLQERQIKPWLIARAKSLEGVRLEGAAADALVELLPPELGVLSQEVSKLSLMAGAERVIDVKLVRENVGGWRVKAAWDMIDAAADGRAAEALTQLDRLIAAGEKPHGLLPQMSATLRRFATATQLITTAEANRQRMPLSAALAHSGVPPFKVADSERHLKQIGRARAKRIVEWLLAADLAVKGHNSSDDRARIELERLIVRLSSAAQPVPRATVLSR